MPEFTIARYDCQHDKTHVVLAVSARCPEAMTDEAALQLAIDVAGVLARLALAVDADLKGNARLHGCDWQPHLDRDGPDEIGRTHSGDGCDQYLLDDHEYGYLPQLLVTVPRNRERAWKARLDQELRKIADADSTPLFERGWA